MGLDFAFIIMSFIQRSSHTKRVISSLSKQTLKGLGQKPSQSDRLGWRHRAQTEPEVRPRKIPSYNPPRITWKQPPLPNSMVVSHSTSTLKVICMFHFFLFFFPSRPPPRTDVLKMWLENCQRASLWPPTRVTSQDHDIEPTGSTHQVPFSNWGTAAQVLSSRLINL